MENPFRTDDLMGLLQRFRKEHPAAPIVHEITANVTRCFIVGGFVRDLLCGKLSDDVDVEVYGVPANALEETLMRLFPGRVHLVGKAFGVFRIAAGEGYVDIAIPRRDSKQGEGHRGFVVEGDPDMRPEDAVRRRDFTVNAMLLDLKSGEIVDPAHGKTDLEANILRAVDPTSFIEDPLRVYRAIQLAARLDLTVDLATFDLMRTMVARGDLATLSPERVTDELKKLFLLADRPSIGLSLCRDLGIVEREYPELAALPATEQEPEWHPEGDVWTHTLMVVDEAAALVRRDGLIGDDALGVTLGALCHDLGKPATTQVIDGRIRSRGHEEAGAEPTETIFSRWTFSRTVKEAALAGAREHLKPVMLFLEREKGTLAPDAYVNAIRRLVRRIAPVPWRVLLAIAEADWRGSGTGERKTAPYEAGDAFRAAMRELESRDGLSPLLEGRDLIALGIKPGPRMGELLRAIEEARDRGEITTREEAMELVKRNV